MSILQSSVELAKNTRTQFWKEKSNQFGRVYPLVAASVGPYGAYLADGSEYRGNYGLSVSDLKDFHRKRLQVLVASKPDVLAIETLPSKMEMLALIELLEEEHPEQTAWMSFSCRNKNQISDGTSWEALLPHINSSKQIIAVGANCTKPEYISSIISKIKKQTDKVIIVYPNKGEDWDAVNNCWLGKKDNIEIEDMLVEWLSLGARIIGGCCRTNLALSLIHI